MAFKSIILRSLLLLHTVQLNTQGQASSTAEDPLVTLLINKGLLTKEGAAYERAPQIRTGFNYNFGGVRAWKIQPEFAIVFPAFDDVPTNVADQLGFGERQGADSSRPASRRYLLFSHRKAQKAT